MSEFDFSVEGLDLVQLEFNAMADRAQDVRPALVSVHRLFTAQREVDFDTGGTTTRRGRWRPHKRTLRAARAKGRRRVLERTGRLRESLTNPLHRDNLFVIGPEGIRAMGTRVPYARFLQEGTRHMVARPPVDPRDEEIEQYATIILTWITTGQVIDLR